MSISALIRALFRHLPHNSRHQANSEIAALRGQECPRQHRVQPTDLRLGRIVRLLMEHATVVVSGTKIAQEISSNRSEVWRLIQQLRGLGVDVAGHPATGYRLRSVPDLLLPEILRPLLRGTIFDPHLHHFYKIGSTNTAAMAAAAGGRSRRQCLSGGGADRGARARGEFLALGAVIRNLLLGGVAAGAATFGGAGVIAGGGTGCARGHSKSIRESSSI